MEAQYIIGIDLGTTNSVLAYTRVDSQQPPELLQVPQLVDAATVEPRSTLPSFLYLGGSHESSSSFALPWRDGADFAVGHWARRQAAEVPDRTVSAAKSWLCHHGIDRRQPILPFGAPAEVPKISPITAAQRYLEHLVAAWQGAFPDAPIEHQVVVLTVPASFDASARQLSREAAIAAGLPKDLILLEEPQAAVYSWLADQQDRWRDSLALGDVLLVCDVGGGTTDLTLISVEEENGNLVLQRKAVGDHLLVGGDNMDLALAHYVAGQFAEKNVQLDPWQSVALWHSCRDAKEALLAPDGKESHTISVLGRGTKLIGGTVSVEIDRQAVSDFLVEGFFPRCSTNDRPLQQPQSGFRELGLPFESDTAVTRHLAAFLGTHGGGDQPTRPTRVLFNGGVFKADRLRHRLLDVMADWTDDQDKPPRLLEGTHDLDYAAARGAAYYGWAKQSAGGVRIRGGTARSYYVGIETSGPAIPGAARPLRGLCVVPIGMEEGTEIDVPSDEIGLIVGQPARFRFFSSSTRPQDQPGDVLNRWTNEELIETDPLVATLPADETVDESYVPVRFQSRITELGMFELWCASTRSDHRWKLEFSVREK